MSTRREALRTLGGLGAALAVPGVAVAAEPPRATLYTVDHPVVLATLRHVVHSVRVHHNDPTKMTLDVVGMVGNEYESDRSVIDATDDWKERLPQAVHDALDRLMTCEHAWRKEKREAQQLKDSTKEYYKELDAFINEPIDETGLVFGHGWMSR